MTDWSRPTIATRTVQRKYNIAIRTTSIPAVVIITYCLLHNIPPSILQFWGPGQLLTVFRVRHGARS